MPEKSSPPPILGFRGRAMVALLFLLPVAGAGIGCVSPSALAQNAARIIQGKVLTKQGAPLPGAIIYLQDQKTNIVKTLIATGDGGYRFSELPADTDYRLWARYKDDRSKDKLVNSFDTKLDITHDFHIDVKSAPGQ